MQFQKVFVTVLQNNNVKIQNIVILILYFEPVDKLKYFPRIGHKWSDPATSRKNSSRCNFTRTHITVKLFCVRFQDYYLSVKGLKLVKEQISDVWLQNIWFFNSSDFTSILLTKFYLYNVNCAIDGIRHVYMFLLCSFTYLNVQSIFLLHFEHTCTLSDK